MARNWAISIGINNYSNIDPPLNYAKRDAEAMRDWFVAAGFELVFLFTEDSREISAKPIPISSQPIYVNLRKFLRTQFERSLLQEEDNLWFFFAGHGMIRADRDYLLLLDSDPDDLEHTAIPVSDVIGYLRRSGADNVVLFLDACRTEGARGEQGVGYQKQKGAISFFSCTPKELAFEIKELQHGSFTYVLLEGLRNPSKYNCTTVEELDKYLREKVPEVNRTYKKPSQHPYTSIEPLTKSKLILLSESVIERTQEKSSTTKITRRRYLELAGLTVAGISTALMWKWLSVQRKIYPVFPTNVESSVFDFEVVTIDAFGKLISRESSKANFFPERLWNGSILEMVAIPGNRFLRGSPDKKIDEGHADKDETPQRWVAVKPFFMSKYPITQAQWKAISQQPKVEHELKLNPAGFAGDDRPVENVFWQDAQEFCQRLSKYTRRTYRLPTEAEWEYACRARTTTPFHFGETMTSQYANYDAREVFNSEQPGSIRGETTSAGGFHVANAFGLFDMHGNVWEWCADHWHDNYQGAPNDGRAWLFDEETGKHLLRGGAWNSIGWDCRSAYRTYWQNLRDEGKEKGVELDKNSVGFRVVCSAVNS